MAELRGATLPSAAALNGLAAAVEGFSQAVIDKACSELTRTAFEPYAPRVVTELELLESCRKASTTVKRSKYCGRCTDGRKRVGGEVVVCECVCPHCEGTGVVFVKANGHPYNPKTDWKEVALGKRCPCTVKQVSA